MVVVDRARDRTWTLTPAFLGWLEDAMAHPELRALADVLGDLEPTAPIGPCMISWRIWRRAPRKWPSSSRSTWQASPPGRPEASTSGSDRSGHLPIPVAGGAGRAVPAEDRGPRSARWPGRPRRGGVHGHDDDGHAVPDARPQRGCLAPLGPGGRRQRVRPTAQPARADRGPRVRGASGGSALEHPRDAREGRRPDAIH